MCTSPTARTGGRILGAVVLVLAMMLVAAGSPASAANSENPALSSGVSANQVRGVAQSTVTDPAADVQYNGTPVVGSGFDYGQVYLWLHNNILYVLVEAYGHPGDSNADGGFNSINGCGATGPGTGDVGVVGVDTLSVNETYIFQINRDCDELAPGVQQWDLQFTLGGFNKDLLWVTEDDLAGKTGNIVGAYNGTWVASPLQAGGDAPGCDPSSRTGAILFQIPNWSSYFVDVNTSQIPAGLSPARFNWRVDGGNGQDLISEDEVTGVFDDLNPQISITKTKSDSLLCAPGGTTVFTVTVADTGNTPVTGVSLVDDLPAGLSYDDNYVDDPVTAIGSPSYDAGLNRLTWPGFDLQPGESRTISFRALSGADCIGTQTNTASASGQFDSACEGLLAVGPVQATATVSCGAACVTLAGDDTSSCPGTEVQVPFRVTNCGSSPEVISSILCTINGTPVVPGVTLPVDAVAAAGTFDFQVAVMLPAVCGDSIAVRCIVNGYDENDQTCADSDTLTVHVGCEPPDIDVEKTASPTQTDSNSTITVVVRNTGATRLNPVQVVDELPPGLTLDAALVVGQTVTGTCGATLDSVKTDTGITWAYFSGFALDAGDSCTISYRVDCGSFDNASRIDTVRVSGWCDGTFGIAEPVTASDTALVVCTGGEACPRTIGFWRQQCAQKGNGSTKVCLEGMYGLWRCVINATGVVQFKLNDGGYETTASLQGLSDADLFAHLCSQLQGPRPMTLRDMTEVQYLGLMLNYCAEALSAGIPVENAFSGTVGAAIDSIEAALNSGVNLGYWEQVADQINNGIGVLARSCPEGDDLFRNLAPCGTTTSPDAGFNFLSTGNPDRLMARAYPNPALRSSGTMIYYNVPAAKADGTVRLTVYDITGRLVRELVNVPASAGVQTATWNLRDASGARVSSGMYFYRLEAGGEAVIQKVLVLPN